MLKRSITSRMGTWDYYFNFQAFKLNKIPKDRY